MKHIIQDQREPMDAHENASAPMCGGTRWEVVEENVAHGWLATWTVTDEAGNEIPETYATEADARAALDFYLADYASELDEESARRLCDPDRYRIREVCPTNEH